ncbi:MAG: addiction module toxin RelE [Chitinophagaceae bacterium]|jgi:mRNA-degrading endonuclease RelE of RelBE toxin-antitoxin system|nr:addiction module toxin RelE [Chitinophagaceae bacterium]
MSYNVIPTPKFKSQAKRLIKKFPSLKQELSDLNITLSITPNLGTPLGNDTFKLRLAVKSKGKGKSGGVRIISFKIDKNKEVYLLTIYDKSEIASIDDRAIKFIIRQITGE